MAKQENRRGISNTLFEDAVCPAPGGKGDWGGMGKVFTTGDDVPETKGAELPAGVQYATSIPGDPGINSATSYKTAGSSRGGSGMGE